MQWGEGGGSYWKIIQKCKLKCEKITSPSKYIFKETIRILNFRYILHLSIHSSFTSVIVRLLRTRSLWRPWKPNKEPGCWYLCKINRCHTFTMTDIFPFPCCQVLWTCMTHIYAVYERIFFLNKSLNWFIIMIK